MRLRSCVAPSVLILLSAVLVGCNGSKPPANNEPEKVAGTPGGLVDPNPDVGPALFRPEPEPPPIAVLPQSAVEPLIISNCTVQYEEKQRVSAEVDGTIEMIAVPLPPGTVYDPNNSKHVLSPRDDGSKKPYRRLSDGNEVKRGDIICVLNDEQVATRKRGAERTKAASEDVLKSAKKGVDLSEKKLNISLKLYTEQKAISYTDLLNDYVTLSRFEENSANATSAIAKATSEYEEASVLMKKHLIVSHVNGFVRNVVKHPGEFVKAGDSILEIQSTDRVRLEGNLDVQYASKVIRDMTVTVEPALPSAPLKGHAWHRQEVTGVAVTPHADRPLVVSTSADGSALVWEPNL